MSWVNIQNRVHSYLLLVVLLVALALAVNAATSTFPPTSITSPYRQTKSIHFMNIDAGVSSLTGSLAMQPATFGTHFPITSTVAGLPAFSAEITLPNSADDLIACRDPTLISHDDFNQSFTGKIMMLRRGTCAFGLKAKRAELAGAAGLIIYGCPTSAPTLCAPGLQQPTVAVTQVGIPVVYIQTADGEALVTYIKARNAAITAGSGSIPSPVVMQVASTGALVASELTALKAIAATTTMSQDTVTSSYGNLRPWNIANMNNASADPCLDRLAGIWCENGHIVEIYIAAMKWSSSISDGSIPPEIGSLTNLRYLSLQSNLFKGAVPPTICQLTKLQELYLQLQVTGNYDGLTSLPSCLNALVSLNSILVNNNQLDSFPDLNASPNLGLVDISNNHILALPTSFSTWTNLASFAGSNNKISVLPSLASLTKLTSFKMSGNLLTDTISTTTFDNLVTLTTLDLSNNQLSGVLPDMKGCTALTSLVLSGNKLSSPIPLGWPVNVPNLLVFKVAHNQIVSPVVVLTSLLLLQTVDLSWNNITAYTGDPTQTGDAGALMSSITGPSVVTMNVAHNNISGYYGNNWLQLAKQLKTLDISYNKFTQLPTDIFALTITSLDASNNAITTWGATTTAPSASFIYLSIINNPGLVAASLPAWMKADVQMVTNPGSVYQCPRIYNPDNTFMTIQVDAQFTSYRGCQCVPGRFGAPPLCYPVPQISTLLQDGSFGSSDIGTNFASVVAGTANRTEPNVTAIVAADMIDRSFSDAWYGNQRLTLGMSTAFVVDLRPSTQAIRFITLHVHINTALFDDSNDILGIYQGPSALTSPRVDVAQGDLPIPSSSLLSDGYIKTQAYQTLYGAKIAAMGSSISLWEVVVLGPVATVSFNSRDTQGQHFFITYSYSYSCEDLGVGYFYDEEQAQCRAPLEMYAVASGIRAAVFALSSLAFVFVAVVAIIVIIYFDTPVIRASSRPFLLLILFFLGMMSLGSLLYAAVPDESSKGKAICNGRVWLAAFPLTGILAILLAKTNRISNIFTSTKFTVRKVGDQELLMVVGAMLAVTSIMLAIYSGVPLNSPRVAEGTSTYTNKLVSSCDNADGFAPWIGILLVYIFVLMIAAAVLAFKARDVPSRYNESTHIMNALFLLIFFGALIVPLDIFIQDSPDASVLIQGIGQSLLVLTLTSIIFLPKLYVLLTDQSAPAQTTEGTTISSGNTQGSSAPNKLKFQTSGSTGNLAGGPAPSTSAGQPARSSIMNPTPLPKGNRQMSDQKNLSSSIRYPLTAVPKPVTFDTRHMSPEVVAEYNAHQQAAKEFQSFLMKYQQVPPPPPSASPVSLTTQAQTQFRRGSEIPQELELTNVKRGSSSSITADVRPVTPNDVVVESVVTAAAAASSPSAVPQMSPESSTTNQ